MFYVLGVLVFLLLVLVARRRRRDRVSSAGAAQAISLLAGFRGSESPMFPESPRGRRFGRRVKL